MSEGKRLLIWLQNEEHMNESIAVELYERSKWKRTTMDGTRSFTIYHPSLVLLARYWESSSGSISATHIRPAGGRERWSRLHTLLALPPFGLEKSLSEVFMQVAEVSWEGLRDRCRSPCEMNIRTKTADPQACAPSIFLPCSIEQCAIDSVNSASPDCRKSGPEDVGSGTLSSIMLEICPLTLCVALGVQSETSFGVGGLLTCASNVLWVPPRTWT